MKRTSDVCKTYMTTWGPRATGAPKQKEEKGGGGFGTYQHYTELEMIMLAKLLQYFHSLVA